MTPNFTAGSTYATRIKIGIARQTPIERHPAHIVKLSRRQLFEVWSMTDRKTLAGGTLEEIKEWAAENGYKLTATNSLGKQILNKKN